MLDPKLHILLSVYGVYVIYASGNMPNVKFSVVDIFC